MGDKKMAFNSVNFNENLTTVNFYKTKLTAESNPFMNNKNLETFNIKDCKNIQYENGQLIQNQNSERRVLSMTKKFDGKVSASATMLLKHAGGGHSFEFSELSFGENSNMKEIQNAVFANAENLKKVVLPKSLENIAPDFAIKNLISEIVMEEGNIEFEVVNNTLVKGDTVVLGSKNSNLIGQPRIKKIGEAAFFGNSALELDDIKRVLVDGIKEIGHQAFAGATSLKGELDLSGIRFDKVGAYIFQNVAGGDVGFKVSNMNATESASDWDERK